MSNININQFAQVAVRGQLDQQIARSGVIQGMVSAANTTTPIAPGDSVILDSAVTAVGSPQFRTAADSDSNFGIMIYDPKSSSILTPGFIQVASNFTGPVMWLVAAAAILPGVFVEQAAAGGDVVTYGTATSKLRGIALDPGATGQLMRVILVGGAGSLL